MNDTNQYKIALSEELVNLENQLKTVGRKNPSNPNDWEAVEGGDSTTPNAEDGDVAEALESFDNNNAVLDQLEMRLNDVKRALEKIESGEFGKCDVCGEKIEDERLEANHAAKTCKVHMS